MQAVRDLNLALREYRDALVSVPALIAAHTETRGEIGQIHAALALIATTLANPEITVRLDFKDQDRRVRVQVEEALAGFLVKLDELGADLEGV